MMGKKPEASPRRRRPYRQLPHTADLAWRLWGKDLPELFENAGRALSATLTDRRYLGRRATRTVRLTTGDGRPSWLTGSTTCFIFLISMGFWAGTFRWSH